MKAIKTTAALLTILSMFAFAQQKSSFTDSRDKKSYKTVKIGTQTWMAENLDYHGEDGYLGLCYGDEPKKKIRKPENCKKYGRLYDWNEAMKACPSGWHLPSNEEWDKLYRFADGTNGTESPYNSDVAGKKLKSKTGWNDHLDDRGRKITTSTDEFGFSALPGGYGDSGGNFCSVGDNGFWWSSQELNSYNAYYRGMRYYNEDAYYGYYGKSYLFSVRCVQD
jgi:uncharacterized protein (TIGR02145 family)